MVVLLSLKNGGYLRKPKVFIDGLIGCTVILLVDVQ